MDTDTIDTHPVIFIQNIPDHVDNEDMQVTIDGLITQMDKVFNATAYNRNRIIDKLMQAVETTSFSDTDNLRTVSKKIMILDTASRLLNDSEKSFTSRINTRLKQKDSDVNVATGKVVVELLKQVPINSVIKQQHVPDLDAQLRELNDKCIANEICPSDDECKTDPHDVPMLNNPVKEDV